MRIAIIGMGRMGRAFAGRALDEGHTVSVWNRTPGRADELREQGATIMDSPDDVNEECDAVFLFLADDKSTLELAVPDGQPRKPWSLTRVVNTGTVAPEVITALSRAYGDSFVNAQIVGAPQAVRSGEARFILGGPASGRTALAPVWRVFAGAFDAGDSPETAAVIKLLNNQMLLTQLAAVAETVRAGRAAGIDDATLTTMLRESPMLAPGLRNRIDVMFDPEHTGWFTSIQSAKDLTLALGLVPDGEALPVTAAARDAYRQLISDGWLTQDPAALVEYGRRAH